MALLVWLPLTGDLHNLGLSNVTVTVSGTTTFGDGKLGLGLSCNGSSYWAISPITLGSTASICWWVNSTDTNAMFWVLGASVYAHLNFWQYNGKYYLNKGDSLDNPFQNNGTDVSAITDGKWHHYAIIFNGTNCLLYIDGTYYATAKTYRSPATANNSNIRLAGGFGDGHSYDTLGSINDFRVYDNVLSLEEIHEISKGLVLHYKMDDGYVEPTVNLVSHLAAASENNIEYNVATWATTVSTVTGKNGIYTFSAYITNTSDHPLNCRLSCYNAAGTSYNTIQGNSIPAGSEGRSCVTCDTSNLSNFNGNIALYIQNGNAGVDPVNKKFYLREVQFEEKDHATPFTSSAREESTVNISTQGNCSGWDNSGTSSRSNNETSIPSIPEPTGKTVSITQVTDGQSAITFGTTNINVPSKTLTASVWFYKTGDATSSIVPYIRSSAQDINLGNLEYAGSSSISTWPSNTWIKLKKTITTDGNQTTVYFCAYTAKAGCKFVFNGWLIEEKNHATTYINGTRSVIYTANDCSGYLNNGTINDALSVLDNSARYDKCTQFNGSAYIAGPINKGEVQSASFWLFVPSVIPTTNTIIFVDGASKIAAGYYNSGTEIILTCVDTISGKGVYNTENLIKNKWNHITIIRTSSDLIVYFNAILQTAKRGDYWTLTANSEFTIGRRLTTTAYSFTGKISDFRLYTTAISEADINLLYTQAGNIDNSGDANFFELDEDETGSRELCPIPNFPYSNLTMLPNGDYTMKNNMWPPADYISINPSGKTYYYDIEYSNTSGNKLYIGFEKYDVNKLSGSNNECQYLVNTTNAADHVRVTGTINLATANGNTAAYTKLRLLNDWEGSHSDSHIGTIHYISLKECTSTAEINVSKTGILHNDDIIESTSIASFLQRGNVVATNFNEI